MKVVARFGRTRAFGLACLMALACKPGGVNAAPGKAPAPVAEKPAEKPTEAAASAPGAIVPSPAPGVTAEGGAPAFPVVAASAIKLTAASTGPQLYQVLCAPCHAADGRGGAADHAPSLISTTFLESASDTFLRNAIANGRPGTSMGAYGKALGGPLDEHALSRLVAFVRSRGPAYRPITVKVSAPRAADATRGAPLYGQLCKTCHGDPQVRNEAIHLANSGFLKDASDAFLKYAILRGRPDTKMVSFDGPLSEAQVDDVVAFVRSFAQQLPKIELLPAPTGHEPMVINPKGKDPVFTVKEDRFVSVEQVRDALAAHRRLIILDARPPSEWMQVHIPGAVSVPYHDLKRLDEVPQDVWAVAYCACPHHLSGDVVNALRARGHARALVLDEGINEWHRRGYPVIAATGVQRPVADAAAVTPQPPRPMGLAAPGAPHPLPPPVITNPKGAKRTGANPKGANPKGANPTGANPTDNP